MAAMCEDFELTDPVSEVVSKFMSSPEGRTRDVVGNLLTLVGYIAALPRSRLTHMFGQGGRFYSSSFC